MKTFTVELGGETYSVETLPIRPARKLRKEIGVSLDKPLEAMRSMQGVELTDTEALADIVVSMKGILFDSLDLALDIVYKYCPTVKADKKRIEDNATDEEAVVAFMEVVKRLFPFGSLKPLFSKAMTGLNSQTSKK